jgi:predicted histidine transporter YuiF (NhaC family)
MIWIIVAVCLVIGLIVFAVVYNKKKNSEDNEGGEADSYSKYNDDESRY